MTNLKLAEAKLEQAIALHERHMDGTAPVNGTAGEKSQREMMRMMKSALAALTGKQMGLLDMAGM
ncbi:MAG: hypothetical protein V4633_13485 [Pseudomonadota bacterium]